MLLRLLPILLASALAIPAAMAHAGPVCGSPEVLETVARMIAARGSDARIEPGPAGQVPTAQPHTVLCAVRVLERFYDTNRFDLAPQYRHQVYEFTVRQGRNGLFVDALSGN